MSVWRTCRCRSSCSFLGPVLVFQSTTLSDVLHIRALLHAGNMAYRIHARGSRRWGYALQAIPGVASSITTQALYEAMYLRFVPAERWDGGLITQRRSRNSLLYSPRKECDPFVKTIFTFVFIQSSILMKGICRVALNISY